MSTDFHPTANANGRPLLRCICEHAGACAACLLSLNTSRGAEVLEHLGLPPALRGSIESVRLAELCRARMAMLDSEEPLPAREMGTRDENGYHRYYECGRRPGYLREAVSTLLTMALTARDFWISWS